MKVPASAQEESTEHRHNVSSIGPPSENSHILPIRLMRSMLTRGVRRRNRIVFIKPSYYIVDNLKQDSVVVDVGTGWNADFSIGIIHRYGLQCHAVDPTRKHYERLIELQKKYPTLHVHRLALSSKDGIESFHESRTNVSGSLYEDHINALNDECIVYEVETVSLPTLLRRIGVEGISLLKMDIEGAEYGILRPENSRILCEIPQITMEFHHNIIKRFSRDDTQRKVDFMNELGFDSFSVDGLNYLFYLRRYGQDDTE